MSINFVWLSAQFAQIAKYHQRANLQSACNKERFSVFVQHFVDKLHLAKPKLECRTNQEIFKIV